MTMRYTDSIPGADRIARGAEPARDRRAAAKTTDKGAHIVHACHCANRFSRLQAPCCATKDGAPSAKGCGTLGCMDAVDKRAVGRRMKAIKKELGFRTTEAFGQYCGADRGAADAWLQGRALPPVANLLPLLRDHGITLEWIFYNESRHVPYATAIRLQARVAGFGVPVTDPSVPAEALPGASPEDGRRPRKKKKAAI